MLDLDPVKLLILLIVAMILLGPDKLPQVARQLGAGWRKIREFHEQIDSELRANVPDLPSTQDLARLARSPMALLNQLAEMPATVDEPLVEDAAASASPPPAEASDGLPWPEDPSAGAFDTNGHTNGYTNGYTNGHTNGYTEGETDGGTDADADADGESPPLPAGAGKAVRVQALMDRWASADRSGADHASADRAGADHAGGVAREASLSPFPADSELPSLDREGRPPQIFPIVDDPSMN